MKTVVQRRKYLTSRLAFHIQQKESLIKSQDFYRAYDERVKERRIATRLKNLPTN